MPLHPADAASAPPATRQPIVGVTRRSDRPMYGSGAGFGAPCGTRKGLDFRQLQMWTPGWGLGISAYAMRLCIHDDVEGRRQGNVDG